MLNTIVFTIMLFYLSVVLGIYIKLIDFRAPKSSIIYAFTIPYISLKVNILAIKSIIKDIKPKNKYESAKEIIKFSLIAIRYSSYFAGIICVRVCKAYDSCTEDYTLKYDTKYIVSQIRSIFDFDILNNQQVVEDISKVLINA